jgi:nicotinate-nucleotide adenylyltransferase
MINEVNYIEFLKKYLKDNNRIDHSISTALFMKEHAQKFNLNKDQAYISGLLHDLAKDFSHEEILNLSRSFVNRKIIDIKYFEYKEKHPGILHGVAAAELVIKELKIYDNDILESICCHTCGGSNISLLSIFAFVCDFCEPLRNYSPSKKVNKMIVKESDIYKAYLYSYIYLIERLLVKQKFIIPDSIDGYNSALKLYKK